MAQFYRRCPRTKAFSQIDLPALELVFRRVADIVDAPGKSVPAAINRIARQCKAALDISTTFPHRVGRIDSRDGPSSPATH